MGSSMTVTLARLLLRLSEAGEPVLLWGRAAAPFFGRAFDRLLELGVLEEARGADEWDPCPDCSCGAQARVIRHIDGVATAHCPLDVRRDKQLADSDLRSFRVDKERLVGAIADALGRSSDLSLLLPGVWLLASSSSEPTVAIIVAQAALSQPGLEAALREAGPSCMVMLSPPVEPAERLRLARTGLLLAPIIDVVDVDDRGRFIVSLPAISALQRSAPALVIHKGAKRAALGEIKIPLSDQTLRLLIALVERSSSEQPHLDSRTVEDLIYGSSVHRVVRTGRDIVRELRKAFVRAGVEKSTTDGLIRSEGKRWRLDWSGEVRLEP